MSSVDIVFASCREIERIVEHPAQDQSDETTSRTESGLNPYVLRQITTYYDANISVRVVGT